MVTLCSPVSSLGLSYDVASELSLWQRLEAPLSLFVEDEEEYDSVESLEPSAVPPKKILGQWRRDLMTDI